jgi:hypothetical protein
MKHFILSRVVVADGRRVEKAPWQLHHRLALPTLAEAIEVVDDLRRKNKGDRHTEYAFRAVGDSQLYKYLPESKIIDARERAACAACQTYRAHSAEEWKNHTFARHGYTKETGWTHPILAREHAQDAQV